MHFRLRDYTPRGLYARMVALLLIPVLVILGLTTFYYYNNHVRDVNQKLSQSIARQIGLIAEFCNMQQLDEDAEVRFENQLGLVFSCNDERAMEFPFDADATFAYDHVLAAELADRIVFPSTARLIDGGSVLDIRTELPSGVARTLIDRKRALAVNTHFFIVWVILFALMMLGLAFAFLRNQVKSILRLSDAAKQFGRGREDPNFKPSGATEVREASHAILDMKRRLTAFADQRTAMLAGVSHDLRTPLTRLKLQLSMMDDADGDIAAAKADLDDMSAMLEEYLAFAQGAEGEPPSTVHLDAISREVAASAGSQLELGDVEPVLVTARPLAVKRAITNLVGNALAYGEKAQLSVIDGPYFAEVIVDDDGPGIPPDKRDDAFRPFNRLDSARTQNTAGTGLGLALTLDTARAHGGDVKLETSPLGGLRVRFRLPH